MLPNLLNINSQQCSKSTALQYEYNPKKEGDKNKGNHELSDNVMIINHLILASLNKTNNYVRMSMETVFFKQGTIPQESLSS